MKSAAPLLFFVLVCVGTHAQTTPDPRAAAWLREQGIATPRTPQAVAATDEPPRTRVRPAPDPPTAAPTPTKSPIFGQDVFRNEKLSFEPQLNIATPDNYVLGPGDEVIIDVWGNSEQTIRQTLSPDGAIIARPAGPVYLAGLTVAAAEARLKAAYARVFQGVQLKVSLGQIRSIRIHVMGEVAAPGSYTVPSLSTLFHVLHAAGGVNDIGSLRAIRVGRAGQEAAEIDVYPYLLKGRQDQDIALRDGDVVIVPPYLNRVTVAGHVKRPLTYELKDDQTLSDLLDYSGGLSGDAYRAAIRVVRARGTEHSVYSVRSEDYGSFTLEDADSIHVSAVLPRFENRVEVRGAVWRAGIYALDETTRTVSELLTRAEGLRDDAFRDHAVLWRRGTNGAREALTIRLPSTEGLRKDDVLEVFSIFDLREAQTLQIAGEVNAPGTFPYAEGMTVGDLLLSAGGLKESASTARVDIARRIKRPDQTSECDARSQNVILTLDEAHEFALEPFDQVYIHHSPAYEHQRNVRASGRVRFAGQYALAKQGDRLTDLLERAGGPGSGAYVEGARLMRTMNEQERTRARAAMELTQSMGRDSMSVERLRIADQYAVGISLKEAMERPGSDCDMVLREGDELIVPEYDGTVRVSGAVIHPTTMVYRKGAKLNTYIRHSGGYAQRAFRRKVYVVHMNGMVEQAACLHRLHISPGCEIIVPLKSERRGRTSLADILGLGVSAASLAAITTSLVK